MRRQNGMRKARGQLVIVARQAAHALAHGDDDHRQLVDDDAEHQREIGEPEPDIEDDGDDDGGEVERRHQPGRKQPVDPAHAPEDDAEHGARQHRDAEGDAGPAQRFCEIGEQLAVERQLPHFAEHGNGAGEQAPGEQGRQHLPDDDQQRQRGQLQHDVDGVPAVARRGATVERLDYRLYPFQKVPSAIAVASPTTSLPPNFAITAKDCSAGCIAWGS